MFSPAAHAWPEASTQAAETLCTTPAGSMRGDRRTACAALPRTHTQYYTLCEQAVPEPPSSSFLPNPRAVSAARTLIPQVTVKRNIALARLNGVAAALTSVPESPCGSLSSPPPARASPAAVVPPPTWKVLLRAGRAGEGFSRNGISADAKGGVAALDGRHQRPHLWE